MDKRDKRSVIIGMHAAWMTLDRVLAGDPVIDGTELSQRMSRFVHELSRTWDLDPLGFPTFDELKALLDEIDKLPTPRFETPRLGGHRTILATSSGVPIRARMNTLR
jgi:hypothetical protein